MLEKALQRPRVILTSLWLVYCVLFLGSNVSDDGSVIDQTGIIIDAIINGSICHRFNLDDTQKERNRELEKGLFVVFCPPPNTSNTHK